MSNLKTHCVVEYNSRERNSGEVEKNRVELSQNIKLRRGVRYLARAENIRIPISFFQIDSNFNTFAWTETDGSTPHVLSVSIVQGSYTIQELITQLEIDMEVESASNGDTNTFTISYTSFDNTVNIAYDTTGSSGTSFVIDTNTLNQSLGYLGDGTETITLGNNLDASNGAETRRKTFINIHSSSLPITNYFRKDGKQPILAHVPITGERWDYQFYKNDMGYKVQLNSDNINELQVELKDEFGNSIDMRGSDYSFQLVIYRQKNLADLFIAGMARLLGKNKMAKEIENSRGLL